MRVEIAPGIFADVTPEQLRELIEFRRANPLLAYFPHGKQIPFHEAIFKGGPLYTIAFFGGNRSGKTHCSVAEDLIQALPREVIPQHLLASSRTTHAILGNAPVESHPDTGVPLLGRQIPCWDEVLAIAYRAARAVPLKYLGVDICLGERGPVMLEINVRPGLQIQNANLSGLRGRAARVLSTS